ncbi:SRPBCC family protein [Variovorax ureilyticus]|uniref:SRPBCC family protein n=1 Tax=Variovorax ureilyticus TaxID=1836198 RepID=A0ABU8VQ32_9BURK
MEVKVDKKVPLDASVDQSWALLSDVRAVAACMPGAQITEQLDDRHYKGAVTSRVGPATLRFAGEIEVLAFNPADHEIQLLGKAVDQTGSSASMNLTARVVPGDAPGRATLVGLATMTVSGKLAQFSGRLIGPASDVILAQFSENFRAAASRVATGSSREPAPAVNELSAFALLRAMVARWFTRLFRGGTS